MDIKLVEYFVHDVIHVDLRVTNRRHGGPETEHLLHLFADVTSAVDKLWLTDVCWVSIVVVLWQSCVNRGNIEDFVIFFFVCGRK